MVVDNELSEPFDLNEGVRQGCPASPTVFAIYIDQLEQFIDERLRDSTATTRTKYRYLGRMLPMLLFADDIVLMGSGSEAIHQLLTIVREFLQ